MERLFAESSFPEGARNNLGSRTAHQWFQLTVKIAEAVAEAAARVGHHEGEMRVEQLTERLRSTFSPLVKLIER